MTARWSPSDLRRATGGTLRRPFAATGVSIDSRTTRPGELFVALATASGDGHGFVADALRRGAAGAMVHRLPDRVDDDAPLLQVGDTLQGLQALGRFARTRFEGRVIAVTGSVGKTTTKEMLRAALSPFGSTWAAEASHNNHWGVPLTLARLPLRAKFCVCEIGTNHPGEIAPLSLLARPHVALVTAIAPAHIGNFGTLAALQQEKLAIAAGLEPNGVRILPAEIAEGAALSFGSRAPADARLLIADSDAAGCTLHANIAGTPVNVHLAAPGSHMAMNAVAALAVVYSLGLDVARAAEALTDFAPVAGRGQRRMLALDGGNAVLLDESYNASSASVRAALSVLGLQPGDRRIAVLGDMLELGHHGPAEHESLAADVVANADLLFTCGSLMRRLHDLVPVALRAAHAETAEALSPLVAGAVRAGDAILVKGSLGSRMKLVVQALCEARGT